jgi:hypothetical protein
MDLSTALKNYCEVVIAIDPFYGRYIGQLESADRIRPEHFKCKVEILSVLEYPSQRSQLQKNTYYERKPYEYKSMQYFMLDDVELYSSNISTEYFTPDFYAESVKQAITSKIGEYGLCDDHEKAILLDHLSELRGLKRTAFPANVVPVNFKAV